MAGCGWRMDPFCRPKGSCFLRCEATAASFGRAAPGSRCDSMAGPGLTARAALEDTARARAGARHAAAKVSWPGAPHRRVGRGRGGLWRRSRSALGEELLRPGAPALCDHPGGAPRHPGRGHRGRLQANERQVWCPRCCLRRSSCVERCDREAAASNWPTQMAVSASGRLKHVKTSQNHAQNGCQ